MGSGTPRPSSPGPHPRGASADGTLALPAHARVSGGAREASAHPAAPGASGSKIKALPGRQLRFVGTVPRSAPDSRLEPPTHPLYGCDQSRPVPQSVASEVSWLSPCTRKRVASRPRRMTGDFLPPLHLPGAALLLSSPPSFCTFSGHAEDPGPPARWPRPSGTARPRPPLPLEVQRVPELPAASTHRLRLLPNQLGRLPRAASTDSTDPLSTPTGDGPPRASIAGEEARGRTRVGPGTSAWSRCTG
ncbi:WAS/WASL-interacting protein family member 1-like [Canis lupus dingo]|uniref:WAS/WASL-interacting protein family member 1-like n=1 Tax=Canis lupus dingo TaxID=286419 RepID=UPI0020C3E820|nr:WAS/WASL-interacting protein family member 1-like [Canis lupus dingo]